MFLILITFLFSPASYAYVNFGSGIGSCGSWIEARETEESNPKRAFQQTWFEGYLTGYGAATNATYKQNDVWAMFIWIDNYCRENPLEKLAIAAHALVKELTDQ